MAATEPIAGEESQSHSHAFWTSQQGVVERAIQIVSRSRRVDPTEAEDLRSEVWLKLLSSPSACLKFDERSSLGTYLVSIVKNVLLDMRVKQRGKWRPSARSRQMGAIAVELDRLVRREGHAPAQAVETLRSKGHVIGEDIVDAVVRHPLQRRAHADPMVLESLPSPAPMPDHLLLNSEYQRAATQAVIALARALARIPAEDRVLLQRRFVKAETIASIANGDRHYQKQLYRKIQSLLGQLRAMVEGDGVQARNLHGLALSDLTNVECGIGFSGPMRPGSHG
jgi:RNA polymerase sigma factor (sigma-70 family)